MLAPLLSSLSLRTLLALLAVAALLTTAILLVSLPVSALLTTGSLLVSLTASLLASLTASLLATGLSALMLPLPALLSLLGLGAALLWTALSPADLWVGPLGVVLVLWRGLWLVQSTALFGPAGLAETLLCADVVGRLVVTGLAAVLQARVRLTLPAALLSDASLARLLLAGLLAASLLARSLLVALWAGLGGEAPATSPLLTAPVTRLLPAPLACGLALLPTTCLLGVLL
ncbi:hypothetical protein SAMN05216559_0936 [Halomicrobium zhouii]|uniref:Uncharacterized protein n=1 Tax=Halomicrobium zhouii TaxID=767519 RepID=A0A1I6KJW8_9EURY|nr:hypothetical protein [Halomicrobium zhouii]SFR91545.1 hypothetical protein SAMN05216559_0936 [Halomicrobium zhouii]